MICQAEGGVASVGILTVIICLASQELMNLFNVTFTSIRDQHTTFFRCNHATDCGHNSKVVECCRREDVWDDWIEPG